MSTMTSNKSSPSNLSPPQLQIFPSFLMKNQQKLVKITVQNLHSVHRTYQKHSEKRQSLLSPKPSHLLPTHLHKRLLPHLHRHLHRSTSPTLFLPHSLLVSRIPFPLTSPSTVHQSFHHPIHQHHPSTSPFSKLHQIQSPPSQTTPPVS